MNNDLTRVDCSFGPSFISNTIGGTKPIVEYVRSKDLIYIPGLGFHTAEEAEARMLAIFEALSYRSQLQDHNGAFLYKRSSSMYKPIDHFERHLEGEVVVHNKRMEEGLKEFAKESNWVELRNVPHSDAITPPATYYAYKNSVMDHIPPWQIAKSFLMPSMTPYVQRNFQEGHGL